MPCAGTSPLKFNITSEDNASPFFERKKIMTFAIHSSANFLRDSGSWFEISIPLASKLLFCICFKRLEELGAAPLAWPPLPNFTPLLGPSSAPERLHKWNVEIYRWSRFTKCCAPHNTHRYYLVILELMPITLLVYVRYADYCDTDKQLMSCIFEPWAKLLVVHFNFNQKVP